MSFRRIMYVPLLLLLLAIAGCAAFSPIDDGSPEEMQKAEMSKDDLWNQKKALEKEKATYEKQLADQQEELVRMSIDLSEQQTEIARANKQVAELNKSVDELNTQMRQIQEARQKEPLKEVELVQPKKQTAKPVKKIKSPKKQVQASPKAKTQETKTADTSAIVKQITDAKQKLSAGKEEPETPQGKKEAETPREKITEKKQEAPPGTPAVKAREPNPADDLSLRMKLFEEAGEKESAAKETTPARVEKGAREGDKVVKPPKKQIARTEPAEKKTPGQKALKIKVLSGDGNIASARDLSKKLGKMGYRVTLIDKAPRSDFDATIIYYGEDHRAAAETMAKRLGSGTATRPLTWSSDFDVIVVTGRNSTP